MKRSIFFIIPLLVGIWCAGAVAQTKTPGIDKRERRQQTRIHQGIKSGELTPAETRRLEAREGKIKADEMRAKSDGKVTPEERRKLNRELDRTNRAIYRKKHNARHDK